MELRRRRCGTKWSNGARKTRNSGKRDLPDSGREPPESEVTTKESRKENFLYVQNDVSAKKQGVHNSEIVKLDYYAGSAIVDLEAVQKLSTLKVFAKNNRIKPEHLEVWLSEAGENWQCDKNISWSNDSEGWKVVFAEGTQARYVKLHSLWDERDEEYKPEDHATYSGNLWNLFEVSYTADGKENSYSYDARGNRLNEVETHTGSNGRVTNYEYYANSDLIKRAGKWYFNYDKNGNLTARGTAAKEENSELFAAWTFKEEEGELWTYEYDLQNRMVKASYSGKGSKNLKERGSYVYDYRGLLVKKTYQNYNPSDLVEVKEEEAGSEITEFYEYTADGRVIYRKIKEGDCTTKTTYIWAATTLWCEVSEGVVYYHHTDHLGTTEVVTDVNGSVVWEAGYEAFGSVLSERGDSSFTPSFTGKFFDKASGLYYFNARWYDSALGRFTSQDPIRDGTNWWNYCNGNPVKYVDPDGRDIEEVPVASFTVGICGVVRLSAGVAVDSKGNVAIYGKIEGGVGAGADIGLEKSISTFSKGIKILSKAIDSINYTEAGIEFLGNVISYPEDTGKGNLSAGLSFKGETIKDWNKSPTVGAFFGGIERDKKGNVSPSIGIQVLAALFLASGTVYGTVYSKEWMDQVKESISNEYYYYEQQIIDYYTQDWYD